MNRATHYRASRRRNSQLGLLKIHSTDIRRALESDSSLGFAQTLVLNLFSCLELPALLLGAPELWSGNTSSYLSKLACSSGDATADLWQPDGLR